MTTPNTVSAYKLNDMLRMQVTFRGSDGNPADPSMMHFLVRNPAGSVATYLYGQAGASVVNVATGVYEKDITLSIVGSWYYRAEATGLVQTVEEWAFLVDPSKVLG